MSYFISHSWIKMDMLIYYRSLNILIMISGFMYLDSVFHMDVVS